MAAPSSDKPVNGNYGSHQGYAHAEAYQPGQVADPSQGNAKFGDQGNNPAPAAAAVEEEKPIPKEMIGWYFVEQYYNTMSKEPNKLYLYYTKKSQFVAGNEAEKVNVAVGQRSISERIKELDIQDCKVRVSNVDSQESAKGILVQVIGEMSNRAAPHRKFVQTFVLAEQPTGYYVLNDIFRYILDEEEEEEAEEQVDEPTNGVTEEQATQAETTEGVPATLTSSDDSEQQKHDAEHIDRKLEEDMLTKADDQPPAAKAATNGNVPPETPAIKIADDAPVAAVIEESPPAVEEAAEFAAAEDTAPTEKPRDPDPTPIASPPKPAKAAPVETPAAPPKPAAPKTWANLVGSKSTPAASSSVKAAPPAVPAPLKPKTVNSTPKDSMTPPSAPAADTSAKPQQDGNSEWQMAGGDNKQRQGRQHSQSMSSNQDNVLAYVKNVTDKVDASLLREKLTSFGKLAYFDVSRVKNCAFVEFENSAAYNACVAANPHNIGGEQIFVEERRPRGNAYGGNFGGRGAARGGRPGGPNDRYNKDGGRGGGYGPRGRGGAMTPRGRGGQPQPA